MCSLTFGCATWLQLFCSSTKRKRPHAHARTRWDGAASAAVGCIRLMSESKAHTERRCLRHACPRLHTELPPSMRQEQRWVMRSTCGVCAHGKRCLAAERPALRQRRSLLGTHTLSRAFSVAGPAMTRLYYTPTSCGAASFIVAHTAQLANIDVQTVDLMSHKTSTGENFMTVNPKGAQCASTHCACTPPPRRATCI